MKRIHWKSLITGASGCGQPLSKEHADAWATKLNRDYPDLHHWVAP